MDVGVEVDVLLLTVVNPSSVYRCKNGYKKHPYNRHFHSFPSDEGKRQSWIEALPNANFSWSKNKRVCDVHWPPNVKRIKVKGNLIPDVPPLTFPGVPSLSVRQTSDKCYRDVESRRVSQEAREDAQEEKLR